MNNQHMVDFTVIIPARYASTRLPGKPLKMIGAHTMIEQVYRRCCASNATRVVIATDDQRIAEVAIGFGAEVCMTSAQHPSGTDRLQEVAHNCGLDNDAIVVNVQGDEPLIPAAVINQVAANLATATAASVATLSEPITQLDDFLNPNVVKVVSDHQGLACYFSRAPIPWPRDAFAQDRSQLPAELGAQRHIGIYAYRVGLLHDFVQWPVSTLEHTESLEQLRVMDNGHRIHVQEACADVPGGVDTEDDLQRVIAVVESQSRE